MSILLVPVPRPLSVSARKARLGDEDSYPFGHRLIRSVVSHLDERQKAHVHCMSRAPSSPLQISFAR